jgi:hypothetical protein
VVFFDQNSLTGDWRAQVRYCQDDDQDEAGGATPGFSA